MHIHYVEDADADILALKRALRERPDIEITASQRIDALLINGTAADVDIVLVDVVRPDAVSIESDVRIARQVTDAPILFLTGLDPGSVLEEAIRAGADAVIAKGSASAELICRFVDSARLDADHATAPRAAAPRSDNWLTPQPTLAEVDLPLAFVESGLSDELARMTRRIALDTIATTIRMLKTVRRLRRLADRDFSQVADCDASRIVDEVVADLAPELAQSGILLAADVRRSARFQAIGSDTDVAEGLDALLTGLTARLEPGDRVRLLLEPVDGGARMTLVSDRPLVTGVAEFFAAPTPPHALVDGAVAELQCGAALLALRAEQIEVGVPPDHRVVVNF